MPLRSPEQKGFTSTVEAFLGFLIYSLLWFSGVSGIVGLFRFLSYEREPALRGLVTRGFPGAYPQIQ